MSATIHILGTNHKRFPIAGRELLAADGAGLGELSAHARDRLGAQECVVLHTCNRVDIHFVTSADACPSALKKTFREIVGGDDSLTCESVYHHRGTRAVEHLLGVACGLDSIVLGEYEILGQIKAALAAAQAAGCAGPTLTRLFDHAMKTGKRARRETRISSGIFSLGQCAVRMAQDTLGPLAGKRLLVLGAGQVGKVTAKHMAAQGIGHIGIYSRTFARAQALAEMLGGVAVPGEQLEDALRDSDVVLGCAAAPHRIVGSAQVAQVMRGRVERPLVIIDLGVPRNVEPAVGDLPGVRLYNVDDLEATVSGNAQARAAEVAAVREIIGHEVRAFEEWQLGAQAAPVIRGLRDRAEAVRQQCLQQVRHKLASLSADDAQMVDYLTELLLKRLLHAPTKALRAHPNGDPFTLSAAAKVLFELAEDDGEVAAGSRSSGRSRSQSRPGASGAGHRKG